MGRKRINKLKYLFVFFIFIFVKVYSQNNINGIILNSKKEKIAFAHIEVKKDTLSNPIYYYTNKEGFFEIKGFTNKCKLKVSALGYQTKIITLDLNNETLKKIIKIVLKEKIFGLNEVVIRTEKPIVVKKDTINFKIKFFAKGTEQTVEELLKTIPSLNIETDGTTCCAFRKKIAQVIKKSCI